MMAQGKETAEQKLLKMIETSSDEGRSSTGKPVGSLGGEGVLTFARNSNRILFVGIILAGLFFFNQYKEGSSFEPQDVIMSTDSSMKKLSESVKDLPVEQRVSYYLAGISSRNIFEPYSAPASNNVVEMTDTQNDMADRIRDLKLVGISWMDRVSTASVMIEDTAKGVTYFLQKDEKIDDITVKTIYAESIELGYEDEEIIISYDKSQM